MEPSPRQGAMDLLVKWCALLGVGGRRGGPGGRVSFGAGRGGRVEVEALDVHGVEVDEGADARAGEGGEGEEGGGG